MSLSDRIKARVEPTVEVGASAETETTEDEVVEGVEEEQQQEQQQEQPVAADAAADAADVAAFCAENNAAAMAAGLIRAGATMDQVKAKVNAAGTIRAMVADAGKISATIKPELAESFISKGLSVDEARTELWEGLVSAQSPEIRGAIGADTAMPKATDVFDKSIEAINARIEGQHQPKEG